VISMSGRVRVCAAPTPLRPSPALPLMVITMNWTQRYHNRDEFLSFFESEQDYIDAMFIQIVMFNFGVWLDSDELHDE